MLIAGELGLQCSCLVIRSEEFENSNINQQHHQPRTEPQAKIQKLDQVVKHRFNKTS